MLQTLDVLEHSMLPESDGWVCKVGVHVNELEFVNTEKLEKKKEAEKVVCFWHFLFLEFHLISMSR